ncbi:FAD-dependent oxidoreductase [Halobacterium wangiae]|uniref:FAD-dependent oxidoreductase n=1 Tax=Halobacterium wangiae TaxID=2902623 RepID=UPI001E4FD5B7|nr:FAD-dependent monooxygenase [Halobacterium wangiae]
MTLSTLPRYDPDRAPDLGGHAVVVGASVAGLLAARVLADSYDRVTVVERDSLDDERRGAPQSRQPHVLLEAGRATIADLLPGYGEALLSAGGLLVDWTTDLHHYEGGGFLADGPRRRSMYAASRPLFERTLRDRVTERDAVVVHRNCRFVDYLATDDAAAVEGVVVRDGDDGTRADLRADLVVDATGRTSRTPDWLAGHGYEAPPVDAVTVDVTYSTAVVDRPPGDRRTVFVPPSPPRTRGGGAFPVEDGRWLVTMQGVHGDDPPTDPEGFREFAASLPVPELAALLDDREWRSTEIAQYPFPSNQRRRYESLDRFPDGLVVVGDALASFNPVYGQGMSVAALEALQLHHALAAEGTRDLPRRFFGRAADVVDGAWLLAVGADFAFPQTEGERPRGTDLFDRYRSRLVRTAHSDGEVASAYGRVLTMEDPPTSLLRPSVLWRVLRPTG